MKAKRTHVVLRYNGVDITRDVSEYLTSFSWADNGGKEADEIQLTLRNETGIWSGEWYPHPGDSLQPTIIETFEDGSMKSRVCGTFTIDELEFSGLPAILSLKAQSGVPQSDARRTVRSASWEDVDFKDIAQDIAVRAGLGLVYDVSTPILFERLDQRSETDVQLLARVCEEEALNLKIHDDRIVIYSRADYDERPAIRRVHCGRDLLLSWTFRTNAYALAKSVDVVFNDPRTGLLNESVFEVPEAKRRQLIVTSFTGKRSE